MSGSRTSSTASKAAEARENIAVALSTERLPWHPAIGERFGIERSAWRALVEAVFPSAKTSEGVILALSYCKARNLDPFKRPVHVVPIWSREKKTYVETVWPGIGELRTTAFRTKLYAGCDETKFGPDIEKKWTISSENQQGQSQQREVSVIYPEWAQATVYRMVGDHRYAIPGPRVYWTETYATQGRNSPVPNDMWLKRPRGQLDKCAEAAALRRAFPEELGDEASVDEVGGFSGPTVDGEAMEVASHQDESQTRRDDRSTQQTNNRPPHTETRHEQTNRADTTRDSSTERTVVDQPKSGGDAPTSPGEGQVEIWAFDAFGEPLDRPEPMTPEQFGEWFATEYAKTTNPEALWEHNGDAIGDASAVPAVRDMIQAARNARATHQDAPKTDVEPQQRNPVPFQAKKPPKVYLDACVDQISALTTEADIDAWVALNGPTYKGNAVAIGVESRTKKRRARIICDNLIAEFNSCTTPAEWAECGANQYVKEDTNRLFEMNMEMFAEMRAVHAKVDESFKTSPPETQAP